MKAKINKNKDQLLLVSGSRFTQNTLAQQLKNFLPDYISIKPCLMDNEVHDLDGKYFTVFSSEETYRDFQTLNLWSHVEDHIIGTRTVLNENLDKILTLPRDEAILFVTDSMDSAFENIKHLESIGFDFLNLIPHYPGCMTDISHITTAITPGDANMIPPGIETVYNIGSRPFDFATIVRVMAHYGVLDDNLQTYADEYMSSILSLAKRVSNAADEASKVMKTVRAELLGNGYYAKHRFSDIIGETHKMKAVKAIAEKIARTDLSVLIEGENGTGKELFASAIHNASDRAGQPFVAINFSALPDQLIESELFGYEDGAFTGAKKGGKVGLLQQASGGTIFMDEIGDISPKIQAKLLRVLQEKEIMKVGGNRIIPIDVRVIAATNRNLEQMMIEKDFRPDLYYRLREGYIYLPALADRKDDIPLLINHWQKKLFPSNKTIAPAVMDVLMEHNWPGNIRELLNTIKFGFAVCEGNTLTPSDLPYISSRHKDEASEKSVQLTQIEPVSLLILKAIYEISRQGEVAGRSRISHYLATQGKELSEYRIRKTISQLEMHNLITSTKGKYGLHLTSEGQDIIRKNPK